VFCFVLFFGAYQSHSAVSWQRPARPLMPSNDEGHLGNLIASHPPPSLAEPRSWTSGFLWPVTSSQGKYFRVWLGFSDRSMEGRSHSGVDLPEFINTVLSLAQRRSQEPLALQTCKCCICWISRLGGWLLRWPRGPSTSPGNPWEVAVSSGLLWENSFCCVENLCWRELLGKPTSPIVPQKVPRTHEPSWG
jgi:hypothetical protein